MSKQPRQLSFSPALPCADCYELTPLGLIYPMSSQVWQLLPLCSKDMEESGPASDEDEPVGIDQLQQLVTNRIQAIEQLQRRRRQIMHAYVRLRRQHAHVKAQRCLRWKLNRVYRLLAEAMEVRR